MTTPDDDRAALEELLILEQEALNRQQDDPWWKWNPTPKQVPFVYDILTGQIQEAWMFAANRTGKSAGAAFMAASLSRFGGVCPRYDTPHPTVPPGPTHGWVVSVTHNASIEVIQPKLFDNGLGHDPGQLPLIPQREIASWNVTHQILSLKNGSTIGFKSAEGGALKMAGAAKDWVLFDEEPPKHIYDEAVIRVAAGRSLLVFGACTLLPPPGQVGGVSWMFDEKIKPWQRDPSAVSWRIYQASIYDNPHLNVSEIRRLESIYPEGTLGRKIRLDGELIAGLSGARAYASFNNQLHVKKLTDFSWRRPLCWCWDFNVEPLITTVGQRHGNVFKVYKEFVLEDNASIEEMVQMFREHFPSHGGEILIYGDASGRARQVRAASLDAGKSEYQLILNYMRGYPMPVKLRVPQANPPVNDRINAVNYAFRDEEGVANIEVDSSCERLISDFEGVLMDSSGRGIKKVHNKKDSYAQLTHASDGFGYWVALERPVRNVRPEGQIDRIIRSLKRPGYGFNAK